MKLNVETINNFMDNYNSSFDIFLFIHFILLIIYVDDNSSINLIYRFCLLLRQVFQCILLKYLFFMQKPQKPFFPRIFVVIVVQIYLKLYREQILNFNEVSP